MARLLVISTLVVVAGFCYFMMSGGPPPMPDMDLNAWWGPDNLRQKQDTSIRPFKIEFSDTMIQELKQRLKNHRKWTPALEGIGFQYGFNSGQLDSWVSYWADKYQFKEREKFFNQYPQFKTNIQGLDIHFLRIKPKNPEGKEVVPMLLLHGWPGSVREFYEAIPLLSAASSDRDFVLELVVPSLPGYGFSDAAVRPGLGAAEMAVVFRNLMHRLGYKQYYVQGGDWGGIITGIMTTLFQKEVLGYHANMAFGMSPKAFMYTFIGAYFPSLIVEPELADRMYPLSSKYMNLLEESGYMHIQSTKPDTVGVAVSDSPSGLLAYILEKFSTWTVPDYRKLPDGGLGKKWTRDQLIDNLMMYWVPNSVITSMRLYSETFNKRHMGLNLDQIPTVVPTWILQAKYELAFTPTSILKLKYHNLINNSIFDDGGHFLAFEKPKEFAEDVLKAIKAFRSWYKSNAKTEL